MEGYNVRILPHAKVDFLDIVDHLNTLSPEAAAKYYEQLVEKTETLMTAPDHYPIAKDTQLRLRGYRILQIDEYIVFFVIRGKTVQIRRILYARRQFRQLF